MTIEQLLPTLSGLPPEVASARAAVTTLEAHLGRGETPIAATYLADGVGEVSGPCILLVVMTEDGAVSVVLPLDAASVRFLSQRLGRLAVATNVAPPSEAPARSELKHELKELFERAESLSAEARATRLMDWIMERIDASRCALVPFEAGAAGPPLAFHMRGASDSALHPRLVPRRIVDAAARTRQPVLSHDVFASASPVPASGSVIDQNVRSYLAVPVVFRGDLLAVCYVDRLERPRPFGREEQASFEAFAYELAAPLLALRDEQRRAEYRALRDARLDDETGVRPALSSSPALEPVLERARRLAPHRDENILIIGETGAGKEVVARAIHAIADPARPFVAVNVSAISSELFESELMGSVRGAFTGAVDREGVVSQAAGGTLFLDELGDLALVNQVKLLRFLQERRVTPVGGRRGDRAVDVRIIAATNRPLDDLVRQGEFRADLLHRFAPPLKVPPLRERREEILPHARAWLAHKARQRGVAEPELTTDAEAFLVDHPWPGNVRQLEMVLSHAGVLQGRGKIERRTLMSLLGDEAAAAPPPTESVERPRTLAAWKQHTARVERDWLEWVLGQHDGNAEAAARTLGCPGSTFRNMLKKHGL